jgi:peptidyl-dipeptidase Dcp
MSERLNQTGPVGGDNPLLCPWTTPFETPPFEAIATGHFRPAFDEALASDRAEISAIENDPAEPSFDNTIAALELSGKALQRTASVFFNLTGSHTNEALEEIERAMAPILSKHRSAMFLSERLFSRIANLKQRQVQLGLSAEQNRVLDRYYTIFVRQGAALPEAEKTRLAEIGERLAALGTQFSQNMLADEKAYALVLETEADRAGLPEFLVEAAARAAADRGMTGKYVITLARSSIEPFLQFSSRRDLREAAFRAWSGRGEARPETDNRPIIAETVALRAERARLLGYASFAQYRLDDTMAKTPEAALGLLRSVWKPARRKAKQDEEALQALAQSTGGNFEFAPWDWRYYSEQRRKAEFDFDEAQIKPFFALERMIEAAFYTAGRLFGLTFREREDIPLYHPDVRAWEVTGADGTHVGLFLGDYFARPSKRSGAWMSGFRGQEKLAGDIRPIIVNVMNFSRSGEGEPALLSFDDARTLFHEFGHALHGLLSNVTYPMLAGTSVPRDFVEFPSQLFEHWLEQPEILQRFATHHRTGEPMPDALLAKLMAARNFNQGFATVEYTSSALVDMDFHQLTHDREPRRWGVRAGVTRSHRHAGGDHHASSAPAFQSYLQRRRLCGGLLQLSMVGGARRGRLRCLRRGRRHL